MIYNTEVFEVADVGAFERALDGLHGVLTGAGATDLRLYRRVDDPTTVLVAMQWPDAETCRACARDHAEQIEAALRPALVSHRPDELWVET